MSLDYEVYNLGDVKLQRGATLRECKLAYKTFGTLSPNKDNVIVYPTWYSGQHYDNKWLVGEGRALDPKKYFIIIPNMLGNGLSSSPEQHAGALQRPALSAGDGLRQRAGTAPSCHREVRHRAYPARDRLVDGRPADVPLGRTLSRHDGPDRAVLRFG